MTTTVSTPVDAWHARALAVERAIVRLRAALDDYEHRANPNWHLQPRVPAGHPDGGQWTEDDDPQLMPVAIPQLLLPALVAAAPRIYPLLRRLPRLLSNIPFEQLLGDERIGPPSARRPDHEYMEFETWHEFVRVFGDAGEGYEWHHIVERRHVGTGRFSPRQIHNTDNVVRVRRDVHVCVSREFGTLRDRVQRQSVRRWLEAESFEFQYNFGLQILRECAESLNER